MKPITITIDNVDLGLLDTQRRDLYKLMCENRKDLGEEKFENLEGLMGLLDYICDKYEVLTYSTDNDPDLMGECDTCGAEYELASRDGRCGDCGECAEHCDHDSTCACDCGCEVPLNGGICVDCGDGTHQNNNDLPEYEECEHAYSTDGEQGICMFCGKDEEIN